MCVTDTDAASMNETQRQAAAEKDIDGAVKRRADAVAALMSLEAELATVQQTHRDIEVERSKAERELKELMVSLYVYVDMHRYIDISIYTSIYTHTHSRRTATLRWSDPRPSASSKSSWSVYICM